MSTAGAPHQHLDLVRGIESRYEHFELHRLAYLRPGEEAVLLDPQASRS
jgi:hypothetical protein